ncbi:MAG: S-methyl-5-thioribose-1-phosphate isomerase [Polyangiaceae bacterium]
MKVEGVHRRSISTASHRGWIEVIDQRALPHSFVVAKLSATDDVVRAIREMWVRGAPLIGAVAAYGLCFALRDDPSEPAIERACQKLLATRPTAVNLRWALDEVRRTALAVAPVDRAEAGWRRADAICEEDVQINKAIGKNGLALLKDLHARKPAGEQLNILTHCNAGWLATVDWGTALAPVYMAHDAGIRVHVWVDETRPRNQGALTAWELGQHGVPHTIVVDNAGGHIMQHRMVDVCIVGTDRVTALGDVCNKIGTYLKALAAKDNRIPFYVALPYPTIDWTVEDGVGSIPIEERDPSEVYGVQGLASRDARQGSAEFVHATVQIHPESSAAANYAFDVTPARLVTGLITERGVATACRSGLLSLYPERAS